MMENKDEDYITISKKEYERLLDRLERISTTIESQRKERKWVNAGHYYEHRFMLDAGWYYPVGEDGEKIMRGDCILMEREM